MTFKLNSVVLFDGGKKVALLSSVQRLLGGERTNTAWRSNAVAFTLILTHDGVLLTGIIVRDPCDEFINMLK